MLLYIAKFVQEVCELEQRGLTVTAITIGKARRPGESSIDDRVVELPLGDTHGITLMPGQSVWKWELSMVVLMFPVFWPVLVVNEGGQLHKYILGITPFEAVVR